jgi:predicted enzyme related to lactoylglutathione lyase
MADAPTRGHVVWHELLTPDGGAAHTFYSKVLKWKSQPWNDDPSYKMFAASTGPLGGTVSNDDGPVHWRHYVEAVDLDAATEQAIALGATVHTPPANLPGNRRYAVLADPQGAVFAMYTSDTPRAAPHPPKHGEFSWMELATTDVEAACEFYGALFGWSIMAKHDMGPIGIYYTIGFEGREMGGAYKKPATMSGPSNWCGYVRVKDIDRAVKAAARAGGTVLNGPMEVPGGDWVAQLLDPHGALFAVHTLAADHKQSVADSAASDADVPAKIEVTAAPLAGRNRKASVNSANQRKPTGKKAAKPKAKAVAKAKPRPAAKRTLAKSVKRSTRKAVKVGKRTATSKAKAAGNRKQTAARPKKKSGAKARKGK